jgi:hypothetical protein
LVTVNTPRCFSWDNHHLYFLIVKCTMKGLILLQRNRKDRLIRYILLAWKLYRS